MAIQQSFGNPVFLPFASQVINLSRQHMIGVLLSLWPLFHVTPNSHQKLKRQEMQNLFFLCQFDIVIDLYYYGVKKKTVM